MMHNADLSYGDSTFHVEDIYRSIGRLSQKRGEQIQIMTNSHRSLAEVLARERNQLDQGHYENE